MWGSAEPDTSHDPARPRAMLAAFWYTNIGARGGRQSSVRGLRSLLHNLSPPARSDIYTSLGKKRETLEKKSWVRKKKCISLIFLFIGRKKKSFELF